MTRFYLKMGDIFVIDLDNGFKRYFQYIADDITQLNSEVIRVFKTNHKSDKDLKAEEIIMDDVDYFAHVVCKIGVKLRVWKKINNSDTFGDLSIQFKKSDDSGNTNILVSDKWRVWELGKDMVFVGKLSEKYTAVDNGIIVNRYDIVDRINLGRYDFVYPE